MLWYWCKDFEKSVEQKRVQKLTLTYMVNWFLAEKTREFNGEDNLIQQMMVTKLESFILKKKIKFNP